MSNEQGHDCIASITVSDLCLAKMLAFAKISILITSTCPLREERCRGVCRLTEKFKKTFQKHIRRWESYSSSFASTSALADNKNLHMLTSPLKAEQCRGVPLLIEHEISDTNIETHAKMYGPVVPKGLLLDATFIYIQRTARRGTERLNC